MVKKYKVMPGVPVQEERKVTSIIDDFAAINRRLAEIQEDKSPITRCLFDGSGKGICPRKYCNNGRRCEYEDRSNDEYNEDDCV